MSIPIPCYSIRIFGNVIQVGDFNGFDIGYAPRHIVYSVKMKSVE